MEVSVNAIPVGATAWIIAMMSVHGQTTRWDLATKKSRREDTTMVQGNKKKRKNEVSCVHLDKFYADDTSY